MAAWSGVSVWLLVVEEPFGGDIFPDFASRRGVRSETKFESLIFSEMLVVRLVV